MKKSDALKKILLALYHYFSFFALMSFVISCCMLLFLSTMTEAMSIELTGENIKSAAVLTFGNVVLLSLICTVIDALRRRFTVDKPVKKIVAAAERIAQGDYSVRIEPIGGINRADGLDEITECYNKMAEALSLTESMQADFIANVSHELKTPLAVMQNYATLLQSPSITDGEKRKYTQSICEACRRLSELVSNILKLSKLENMSAGNSYPAYNLSEQLCECLLGFENIWEQKSISIHTELDENVYACGDPELLSLVWNNLISNALKFTEDGGRVSVTLARENGFAVVCICDSGCGISDEVGRHMFERFYQGDTSHATQGNGLGLSLVRKVIDIIGGEISVQSTLGVGSIFTVKLEMRENG